MAGFELAAAVELDTKPCETLKANRPAWDVREQDLYEFDGHEFDGIDLVAAGVPCPPFSIAGKQLGAEDERDLFPPVLRIVEEVRPRAVLIENVRGLMAKRFDAYRSEVSASLPAWGTKRTGASSTPRHLAFLSFGREHSWSPCGKTIRRSSSGRRRT